MSNTRARRRARRQREQRLGVDYARYSDKKQNSIADQQATNREVAAELGITLVESFRDEAVSRSVQERAGLIDMFKFLHDHAEVGFIVVPELERLTAGVSQRAEVTRMCQAADIHIASEDREEPIDPFNQDAMQEADERAVAANREVLKIRRRVKRTLKQKALAGTALLRPPYGIRMKPLFGADGQELPPDTRLVDGRGRTVRSGEIEPHPDELPWLTRIFEWAAAGKSPREIGRLLLAEGVPTKTGRREWANRTITGIVANPLYKGEMTWGKRETVRLHDGTKFVEFREQSDPSIITLPSPLGALVDLQLWQRANDEITEHIGTRHRDRRVFPSQPFDGFVYCGRCGNRMYGRSDGNLAYGTPGRTFAWRYCCLSTHRSNAKVHPGFPGCPKAWTLSEKKILAALSTLGLPGGKATVRPVRTGDDELAERRLQKELDDLAAKRQRVADSYEDGLTSREQMRSKRDEIDGRMAVVRARLDAQTTSDAVAPTVTAVRDRWKRLIELVADPTIPVTDRAEAFGSVVRRLYLDGELVKVELVSGDASFDSPLLGLKNGNNTQHSI